MLSKCQEHARKCQEHATQCQENVRNIAKESVQDEETQKMREFNTKLKCDDRIECLTTLTLGNGLTVLLKKE